MSEFVSRVYVSTEAVVICFPVTLLFVAARLPAQIFQLLVAAARETVTGVIAALFVLAMFACVWRLAAAFVLDGRVGLRSVSAYWWVPPLVGAVLGLGISVHWWLTLAIAPSWAVELAWALPFVVPLLHLCVERSLRPEPGAASAARTRIRDGETSSALRAEFPGGESHFDATIFHVGVAPASRDIRLYSSRSATRARQTGVPFA